MMALAEEGAGLKEMDMHLPTTPLFLRTHDGMKDFADVKAMRMKR